MRTHGRNQVIVVVAGLLGIVVGQALRDRTQRDDTSEPVRLGDIQPSSLHATPALAAIAMEAIGGDVADVRLHAAASFLTGIVLTLAADTIGQRLPGVVSRENAAEG